MFFDVFEKDEEDDYLRLQGTGAPARSGCGLWRWLLMVLRWMSRSLWYIGAIAFRPLFEGFSRSLVVYLTVLAVFLRGRSTEVSKNRCFSTSAAVSHKQSHVGKHHPSVSKDQSFLSVLEFVFAARPLQQILLSRKGDADIC